jgi:hypothetical protein
MGLWLHQGKPAASVIFHWPSIVDPVINPSSWASAEESNMFFCKQKHAPDQRVPPTPLTPLPRAFTKVAALKQNLRIVSLYLRSITTAI